ncbi:tail length tape measure protein [Flavobacterium phage vB_FspS_hattifnatt9-1]|uniref:Tail tape measure protein n=1 Tax=Flavobacterium phage vB_FspS_hattifnatt9-1 TaxID=2686246 RepID=A0A6B9L9R0_9CAUD|nr:tail length tape measure protein [Flavobacterium phage vB_FspS_hattifnatt9-1]QHB38752.1 tail tape measure protein [Flavobacterium phage vB_FspS_hattifnatt9-1]
MTNVIDILVSKQAQAELDKVIASLKVTHEEIIKINQQGLKINSGSTPKNPVDLNATIKQNEELARKYKEQEEKLKQLNAQKQKAQVRTSEEIVNQRALAQASDRQARATSNLVGAMANLNAKHQQAKKTLQDLIASQTASNAQIRKAQREYDALDRRVVNANNAVRQFNYNVGNYPRQAVASIRNLMSAFGLFGGVYLFASAVKSAFKTIKDFDKANADLAATMGKSRKEISALTDDQKRLGASTKFTATEVAGLQKEYAKLGFTQTEILNATEATLSLAAAVETDLANASMVAGSTLRGFGLDASEMGRVVDVMAKSFTSSALDIENFRESMKYVAPIAKASGVSIEFTTAMLGKLADAGIKGSQAGTALRRILAEMAKTGKPASQALDLVAKSGISVGDAMDEVGRNAQTALLVLSKSKDGINELAKSLDNAAGSAKAMADIQLDSLEGKITLLTSAWDGFILSLEDGSGTGGAAIGRLIDNFTELLNKLSLLEAYGDKKGKIFFENWKKGVSGLVPKETLDAVDYFNRELEKTTKIADGQEKIINNLKKQIEAEKETFGYKYLANKGKAVDLEKELIEATKKYNASLSAKEYLETSIKEKSAERLRLESEFITAFTLRNKQVSQSVALDYAKIKTDAQLKREIGLLTLVEDKNTEGKKKNNKEKKESEILTIGSEKWINKQISDLRELNSTLSTTTEEYQVGVGAIKFYEQWLERLRGTSKKVKDELDGVSLDLGGSEFLTDIDGDELMRQGDELRAWYKEFREGFQDDFWANSGFDKINFIIENFDKLKESGTDMALAISEAFQQAFNTISTMSDANYQTMFSNLERQRDVSILFAGESTTAREEIERVYEERRKRIQRQQAESQKRLAMFNIATNTAQAVMATYAKLGFPAGIPLAIAVGAIGAVQLAMTAAQPIPQFYKGTQNAPEGLAWTDEKGAELHTDSKGNIKDYGSSKGARLKKLDKGDKIYTATQTKKMMDLYGFNQDFNNIMLTNGISTSNFNNNSVNLEPLNARLDRLTNVVANKSEFTMVNNESGTKYYERVNGQRRELVNSVLTMKSRTIK